MVQTGKRKPTLADRADRFRCYQLSVQSPDHEVEFFEQVYKEQLDLPKTEKLKLAIRRLTNINELGEEGIRRSEKRSRVVRRSIFLTLIRRRWFFLVLLRPFAAYLCHRLRKQECKRLL